MFEIFRDNISGEKTFWEEAFFGIYAYVQFEVGLTGCRVVELISLKKILDKNEIRVSGILYGNSFWERRDKVERPSEDIYPLFGLCRSFRKFLSKSTTTWLVNDQKNSFSP